MKLYHTVDEVHTTELSEEEGVALNVETSRYLSLTGPTLHIVEQCKGDGKSVDQLHSQLQSRYELPSDYTTNSLESDLLKLEEIGLVYSDGPE